jgi:hypothetical protein
VRRAAILEQVGRPAEALPLLERFVTLWSGADDELEPVMADARARLGRLRRIVISDRRVDSADVGGTAAVGDLRAS